MRPWSQVGLLAKRDFTERATSKTFLVTMSLLVVAILAIGPIVNLLSGGGGEATKIGLQGTEPPGIEQQLGVQAQILEMDIAIVRFPDRAAADAALTDGDVAVVLVDETTIVFHSDESSRLSALVGSAVTAAVKTSTLAEFGLTDSEVASVIEPVPLDVATLEVADPQEDAKSVAAFVGTVVLYLSILMFGQFVAMGTVEEKQNRVVEVILARVRPWQILVGKVTGIGLLGLLQLLLLGGAAFVTARLANLSDIDLAEIGLPIIAGVIFWFVLGYAFYAFLYAAVGSTVSRQEDLQGAMMLPIILILPGYFVALIAAESPDALLPTFSSLFPPWAPFVMPVRIAAGVARPWEVVIAVVGTALAAAALVWIGSRVYAGAVLRTGGRVKFREAWRSATE